MRRQKGAVLLALIIAILVTSVLTTGIMVMNVTSQFSSAKSTNFIKALYLAEAGARYGLNQAQGPNFTYTMSDSYQQMIVQKDVNGNINSTGIVYPGTVFEARMTIRRGAGNNLPPNDTRDNNRNVLPVNPATFTGGDLSALDLTGISSRVAIMTAESAGGAGFTHAYWMAMKNFTSNAVLDSDNPGCNISYLFAPISQTYVDYLRDTYNTYGSVSYSFQAKVGWLYTINYAAQGLNFRWHEHPSFPGKYQGYALSFMVFNSRTACSDDYIPNSIKPGPGNSLHDKLLLVLWKQWVDGSGTEHRNWLAYAELGGPELSGSFCTPPGCSRSPADNDPMVTGRQDANDGRVNDDATIGVRIEDVIWGQSHHNEIKVFYGDASPYFAPGHARRAADANATNTNRLRYVPQWITSTEFTRWPSHFFENLNSTDNTLTYWSYAGWLSSIPYVLNGPGGAPEVVIPTMRNAPDGLPHHYTVNTDGTSGLTEPAWPASGTFSDGTGALRWQESGTARPDAVYDYFTVLNTNPQGTNNTVQWILNPAATEIALASDNSTLRTYEFLLTSFPAGRKELGLHGMVRANVLPMAFDDLSFIIMGKKE